MVKFLLLLGLDVKNIRSIFGGDWREISIPGDSELKNLKKSVSYEKSAGSIEELPNQLQLKGPTSRGAGCRKANLMTRDAFLFKALANSKEAAERLRNCADTDR